MLYGSLDCPKQVTGSFIFVIDQASQNLGRVLGNNLLHQITEPVLRPARKILPPMSGMDLSPMLAMVGLWLIKLLLLDPLGGWAKGMMYPAARVIMN